MIWRVGDYVCLRLIGAVALKKKGKVVMEGLEGVRNDIVKTH